MRIPVEDYVRMKQWKLYMCAPFYSLMGAFFSNPSLQKSDTDICLLTLQTLKEIHHTVVASDDNVYDAIALHTWLRTQRGCFYVIPGNYITYVECSSVFLYWAHMLCRYAKRAKLQSVCVMHIVQRILLLLLPFFKYLTQCYCIFCTSCIYYIFNTIVCAKRTMYKNIRDIQEIQYDVHSIDENKNKGGFERSECLGRPRNIVTVTRTLQRLSMRSKKIRHNTLTVSDNSAFEKVFEFS